MPSLKEYRVRIESVKSTRKITSAMKMVAASKLKRAQEQAEAAAPYAERMARVLEALANNVTAGANLPKLLIGTGLFLATIPAALTIVGWIVPVLLINGYLVRLTRNVIAGDERPLPEWADWGGLLRDGAKLIATLFLYALPAIAIGFVAIVPGVALANSGNEAVKGIGVVLTILGGLLTTVVAIGFGLAQPLVIGRYAATGAIGATLQIRAIVGQFRPALVTYLLVFLLGIVTGMVANLGIIAFGVGVFLTAFYAQLVNHHLYGQAYRRAQGDQPAAPSPAGPLPQPFLA